MIWEMMPNFLDSLADGLDEVRVVLGEVDGEAVGGTENKLKKIFLQVIFI